MSDPQINAVRVHAAAHARRARAMFSIAGINACRAETNRLRAARATNPAEAVAWRYSPDGGAHWHLSETFAEQGTGWIAQPLFVRSPQGDPA